MGGYSDPGNNRHGEGVLSSGKIQKNSKGKKKNRLGGFQTGPKHRRVLKNKNGKETEHTGGVLPCKPKLR